jgi:hypothetical protein
VYCDCVIIFVLFLAGQMEEKQCARHPVAREGEISSIHCISVSCVVIFAILFCLVLR